jgi:glutamate-ammonia-ligase adenylyltransferase
MLEEYLQVQGREWERFAWLKSRVVAPRAAVASGRALALRSLVTPFVYRRYLDYGVFEGLRQLHRKIRDEAQRRAAGRPSAPTTSSCRAAASARSSSSCS